MGSGEGPLEHFVAGIKGQKAFGDVFSHPSQDRVQKDVPSAYVGSLGSRTRAWEACSG